jgi:hypothetical protein
MADHDDLAAVLEQSAHGIAELTERVVDQDEVDRAAAAVGVEVFEFADQVLAEDVVELLGAVSVLVDVDLLLEQEDWLHGELDRASVGGVSGLRLAPDRAQVALFEGVLNNRLDAFELGLEVIDGVEAVEELAVQLVVEHFGKLIAADGVCDVDFEQTTVDTHDVLEREYLVFLPCCRFEFGLDHA